MEDNKVQLEYKKFFNEIKQQIKSSQAKAAMTVNSTLIQLYWNIGKQIAEKQTEHSWGTKVIEQLSRDLKTEFPSKSGFSARNLFDTKRFYLFYSNEICRQLLAKLEFPPNPDKPLTLSQESTKDQSLIFMRQLVAQIPWGPSPVDPQ